MRHILYIVMLSLVFIRPVVADDNSDAIIYFQMQQNQQLQQQSQQLKQMQEELQQQRESAEFTRQLQNQHQQQTDETRNEIANFKACWDLSEQDGRACYNPTDGKWYHAPRDPVCQCTRMFYAEDGYLYCDWQPRPCMLPKNHEQIQKRKGGK